MDRKPLPHRENNRIPNYDYSQTGSYYLTICTKNRNPVLSKILVGAGLPDCPVSAVPNARGQSGTPDPTGPRVELLPYGEIADKYIRQMDAFYEHISVECYVIMPDHIHLLVSICRDSLEDQQFTESFYEQKAPCNSVIAQFVGTFKRFCNKEYGENIWQRSYYDHAVRNQTDYNEIWEYIENNPQKWAINHER